MPPKKRRQGAAKANKESEATEASPQGDAAQTGSRKRKRGPPAEKGEERDNQSDSKGSKPDLTYRHWLMKSEPESRIENGVDVKVKTMYSSYKEVTPCGDLNIYIAFASCSSAAKLKKQIPETKQVLFGIEDLKALPNQTSCWDGVRNYQARNFMRDMKVGQQAFFYHSNCKEPGIAGIIKIVKEAYVDHTQFEKKDVHFDPSSKPENPKWSMVDVKFEKMTKRFIPLAELKKYHLQHKSKGGPLANMALFTRARLSVQPLTAEEFDFVLGLEDADPI